MKILSTDASYQGLGAILSQSPDGSSKGETVIAYVSRSLKSAEENYAPTHLEALGVGWAVYHFRHYIAGRRFKLFTDHAGWEYIFNNPKSSSNLIRWTASLMEYGYTVIYQNGADNPADIVNALSPKKTHFVSVLLRSSFRTYTGQTNLVVLPLLPDRLKLSFSKLPQMIHICKLVPKLPQLNIDVGWPSHLLMQIPGSLAICCPLSTQLEVDISPGYTIDAFSSGRRTPLEEEAGIRHGIEKLIQC